MYRPISILIAFAALGVNARAAQAQAVSFPAGASVIAVSGDSVDRIRIAQLDGQTGATLLLLRSLSTLTTRPAMAAGDAFSWVLPLASVVAHSALPGSESTGSLWAGRGPNFRVAAGVDLTRGRLRVTLIPEFVYSSNEFFEYTQFRAPALPASRNPYASPWNVYPFSIDAPPRMGPNHIVRLAPGQSSISMRARDFDVGVTTENEWWGPGIRTAIVLSDNAEGFPRAFVKPSAPRSTRAGMFDFRLTWGGLSESAYFDNDGSNNLRYWSAFAGTWSPAYDPDLTLGFARAVYGPASSWGAVAVRPLNFLAPTSRPNSRSAADTSFQASDDQILSLFGRWVFPSKGFEAYGEWARAERPASFRDLLVTPGHSQGYTFGLQWAARPAASGRLRIQAEHSYL
ncbi:MAG: hypothetical protein H0W69_07955, partial [Gemmatimonadaceae bacterium]|nr:hypothetical protein [Gemmatimonadaceae bacterium]